MDEERVYRAAEEKAESVAPAAPHAFLGKADSAQRPASKSRAIDSTAAPYSRHDLASFKAPVPETIALGLDLASEGECAEADRQVEAYAADYPEHPTSGAGWLEVARCFLKKGDIERARETAQRALKIESSAKEAQAFLESLPSLE
jgi:hypothetical protein